MLSEGYVVLHRDFNGPGVLVHRATADEYVTLLCAPTTSLVDGPEKQATVRIHVGRLPTALHVSTSSESIQIVAPNLPILAGDEVWVACSAPNACLLYGFTSKRPVPSQRTGVL
tara:strand:- start:65 stop:406 length:342 start_codon:yes stop_codon:yes gene_type:complete